MGGFLNPVKLIGNSASDLNKNFIFKLYDSFLCAENLCFKILQLTRYKSLAVCKRLFSYVFLGNKLLKGIRHFDVVAENSVIADFQLLDSRFLLLGLLNGSNITLAVMNNISQLVKLGIKAVLYHVALTDSERRFFLDGLVDKLGNIRQKVNAPASLVEERRFALGNSALDIRQKPYRRKKRTKLLCIGGFVNNSRHQPFHVADI